jgi:hypothetical protein
MSNDHTIGCKWIFKTKYDANNNTCYKARLVIKGYDQTDFGETFTPVTCLTTFLSLLALAAQASWKIHQMDVVSAFLNLSIHDTVFMQILEGLDWLEPSMNLDGKVCRLRKALYGLRQALSSGSRMLTAS